MFKGLKKHFIPHEANDNRPHFLRDQSTSLILVLIIFVEVFSFIIPTLTRINLEGGMAAVLPAVLSNLTNNEREEQNLNILTESPVLDKVAQMKAEDMATKSYFAHTSPEGHTPWYWFEKAGYKYEYAGENLAINFRDSEDVTQAWMNSPTHKANIIKNKYTEIGTGVAYGTYEGRYTVFVAQVYANPLPIVHKITPSIKIAPVSKPAAKTEVAKKVAINSENVLGTETAKNIEPVTPVATPIKIEPVKEPTLTQSLIASPRNTTNSILMLIFGFISLALMVYIVIRMKNHHLDLLTNGLATLALIGAVTLTNHYFIYHSMVVSDIINSSTLAE